MSDLDINIKVDTIFSNSRIIGSHFFDNSEYEQLVNITSQALKMSILTDSTFYIDKSQHVIFIMLVEAAKRWQLFDNNIEEVEKEGGFWNYIFNELDTSEIPKEYHKKIYRKLCDVVNRIANKYGKAKNAKVYYGTVLMHALAPKKSLNALFGLAYSIFKNDFDYEYSLDDEVFTKEIVKALQERIENTADNYGNATVTVGTTLYALNVGIKEMILNEKLSLQFINFFKEIMETIHHLFHHEKMGNEEDNYFIRELKIWWNQNLGVFVRDRQSPKSLVRITTLQNFYPRYVKIGDKNQVRVLLEIPSIRTITSCAYCITIFDGDKKIITDTLQLVNKGITITSKQKQYDLNLMHLTGCDIELRVVLSTSEKVVFDSKKGLYRQLILFNNQNEIFSSMNSIGNYFVFSRAFSKVTKNIKDFFGLSKNIYSINVTNGNYLRGLYRHYIFSDGNSINNNKDLKLAGFLMNLYYIQGEIMSLVFNDSIKLIVPRSAKLNSLELRTNDLKVILKDFIDSVPNIKTDGYFEIDVSSIVNPNIPQNITIFSYDENKELLNENIALFKDLRFSFDADVFFSQKVKSGKIQFERYTIVKNIKQDDEYLFFEFNEGYFQSKVPWFLWKLTDTNWSNKSDLRLKWIDDVINPSTVLEIALPTDSDNLDVFVHYGSNSLSVARKNTDEFLLGRSIFGQIIGQYDYIYVFARKNDELYELFAFSNKERMNGNPIFAENDLIVWQPKNLFIGDGKTKFMFTLNPITGQQVSSFQKRDLELEEAIFDVKLFDGAYQLEIFKVDSNPFINKNVLIYKDDIYVGNQLKAKYFKKVLRLTGFCFDQVKHLVDPVISWGQTNVSYYISDLDYIDDTTEMMTFYGRLFFLNNKKQRIYCDEMKDDKGIYRKINPVLIKYISSDILTLVPKHKCGDINSGFLVFNDVAKQLSFDNSGFGKQIRQYEFVEE